MRQGVKYHDHSFSLPSGTRFLRRFRPLAPHGGRIPLVPDVQGRELVVHSCPYCGCPGVYLVDTDGGGRTVACPACGMSGPESVDGDDTEAERGWEILCGRMCRRCSKHLLKKIKELKAEIASLQAQLARKGGDAI